MNETHLRPSREAGLCYTCGKMAITADQETKFFVSPKQASFLVVLPSFILWGLRSIPLKSRRAGSSRAS